MTELNLEWIEAGSLRTKRVALNQVTKQPGLTRIGRDPSRCDIVLADGSVSGLHVEIGYDPQLSGFYIQNLRESNPPIINSQSLIQGRKQLLQENTIQLGNLQIRATVTMTGSSQPNVIPETELQSFAVEPPSPNSSSPQYAPPQSPQYFQQPTDNRSLNPRQDVNGVRGVTNTAENPTLGSNDKALGYAPEGETKPETSKSPLMFLILGGVLLGLFALAWPNIQGFFGGGESRVISEPREQDSDPAQGQISITELELYSHPSGLFEMDVPRDWRFLDNSQVGDIVIQGWRHPQRNAYVIIRIFAARGELNTRDLQAFSQRLVEDLFADLDDFQRGEPQQLSDDSIQVLWEARDGADQLLASTFVRQDGLNVSALTVWIPADHSNDSVLQNDIDQIVSSLLVDPVTEIP